MTSGGISDRARRTSPGSGPPGAPRPGQPAGRDASDCSVASSPPRPHDPFRDVEPAHRARPTARVQQPSVLGQRPLLPQRQAGRRREIVARRPCRSSASSADRGCRARRSPERRARRATRRTPDSAILVTPTPAICAGGQSASAREGGLRGVRRAGRPFRRRAVKVHGVLALPERLLHRPREHDGLAGGGPDVQAEQQLRISYLLTFVTCRLYFGVYLAFSCSTVKLSQAATFERNPCRWPPPPTRRLRPPRGIGVAAFNVITLEHAEAIVAGAERRRPGDPADQRERGEVSTAARRPIAAAVAAIAGVDNPGSVHLDHVEEPTCCMPPPMPAPARPCSTPPHWITPRTSPPPAPPRMGARRGLFMEAELGEVGGKDGAHAPGVRTDPGEAAQFVAATGVDALAVAVGSSHAMAQRSALGLRPDRQPPRSRRSAPGAARFLRRARRGPAQGGRRRHHQGQRGDPPQCRLHRGRSRPLESDDGVTDPRRYLVPARNAVADAVAAVIAAVN